MTSWPDVAVTAILGAQAVVIAYVRGNAMRTRHTHQRLDRIQHDLSNMAMRQQAHIAGHVASLPPGDVAASSGPTVDPGSS